jgi:Fe-S-cluster containining protein
MHMRTPPFAGPTDPHWQRLSAELKAEVRDWVMDGTPRYDFMVKFDGNVNPCIWLDLVSGKCRHYELRPQVCRDYEVGNQSCRTLRREVGLTVKGMPVPVED